MTAGVVYAVIVALLVRDLARLIAADVKDRRAKAEAESKRQHDERMAVMPAGGAE